MSASSLGPLRPVALSKQGDDGLIVDWSDGHRGVHTWKYLRDHCPCAGCREEKSRPPDPFRVLTPQELLPRPPLAPAAIIPTGRYGYRIAWNDGHDTGIYTLEYLRSLCECTACQPRT